MRRLVLGDGIQSAQVDARGYIWTSYFDEGVFGNYGWNEPVGDCGLITWDASGDMTYRFDAPSGLDRIVDCYMLNVTSRTEAWLSYYTEFPLVHLRHGAVAGVWRGPLRGAAHLVVSRCQTRVMTDGGYNARDTWQVLSLTRDGNAAIEQTLRLTVGGVPVDGSEPICARGHKLFILKASIVYAVDLELLAR